MSIMLEKAFRNEELGIELTSYLDNKQIFFFLEKMLQLFLVIVIQKKQ